MKLFALKDAFTAVLAKAVATRVRYIAKCMDSGCELSSVEYETPGPACRTRHRFLDNPSHKNVRVLEVCIHVRDVTPDD